MAYLFVLDCLLLRLASNLLLGLLLGTQLRACGVAADVFWWSFLERLAEGRILLESIWSCASSMSSRDRLMPEVMGTA